MRYGIFYLQLVKPNRKTITVPHFSCAFAALSQILGADFPYFQASLQRSDLCAMPILSPFYSAIGCGVYNIRFFLFISPFLLKKAARNFRAAFFNFFYQKSCAFAFCCAEKFLFFLALIRF